MTGPAGTLFTFRTDVLHRGSRMSGERSTRFALLADYDVWAPRWTGRVAWAERSDAPDWFEIVERASPRERSVSGSPLRAIRTGTNRPWPTPKRATPGRPDALSLTSGDGRRAPLFLSVALHVPGASAPPSVDATCFSGLE